MHLLAGDAGRIDDGAAAVDLGQAPGDLVVLSSADTELSLLAAAAERREGPSLRLANLMQLAHPLSVDLYVEQTLAEARLVVVRAMGGVGYWPYGLEQLRALARGGGPQVIAVPGEDRWDDGLEPWSTVPVEDCRRLWRYLVEGGAANAEHALAFMASLVGLGEEPPPPEIVAPAGCYVPGIGPVGIDEALAAIGPGMPLAPIVFYRSVLQAGSTEPVDALQAELGRLGIAGLPVFVTSLKDRASAGFLDDLFSRRAPDIVLNTTAFAVSAAGGTEGTVLDRPGRPVLQVVLAGSTEAAWRESLRGLLPRDLVMNVALPEIDGRILTRAISFKEEVHDRRTDSRTARYRAVPDRVRFVAELAAAWVRLGRKPAAERRIAFVLSNYPDRDGRIANGVGLDTPESAARLATMLRADGYDTGAFPETGAALMAVLLAGQTNALRRPALPLWEGRNRAAISGRGGFVGDVADPSPEPLRGSDPPPGGGLAPRVVENRKWGPTEDRWVGSGSAVTTDGSPALPLAVPASLDGTSRAPSSPRWGEDTEPCLPRAGLGDVGEGAGAFHVGAPGSAGNVLPPHQARPGSASRSGSRYPLPTGERKAPPSSSGGVEAGLRLSLPAYLAFLDALPESVRAALTARWGRPEDDPFFAGGCFRLAVHRFGNLVVGIQPSRGYGIDPKSTYHDPGLVPPHHYLAFHAWLRTVFAADAVVHVGKHGNLEWLPGKALGLSAECWPEVALGPLPLVYPFIVNDPGEGAQAKRRGAAVVVDHLMPAITRAELHGPLAELEVLIDEYYLAAGVDARRRDWLEKEIIATAERHGLDRDLGFRREDAGGALQSLDAHLCELKELQIRDGLHIFGQSPEGRQRVDTLVAIARVPRAGGGEAGASLHRAIAADLGLDGFDPLDCDMAAPWQDDRPDSLAVVSDAPWRTAGDTVERIEALAVRLVEQLTLNQRVTDGPTPPGTRTRSVLGWIVSTLGPALDSSGDHEMTGVRRGLGASFVSPGPSGAPSRGRPEVLPTGRNFYAVDVRSVPTPAAWALGRMAAEALALRYFQDEGAWPRSVAISAWGTSNMRTGGDDIAQVLAFIGAKPLWDKGSGRVTGFAVVPLAELGRPRIDVTLKISGMFRDAFPAQIDLVDSAVRAIAALAEDDDANPIAAAARDSRRALIKKGVSEAMADRAAAARVFGAKPGAYGSGMQAMVDEGIWERRADFADTFLAWGGFAYGGGSEGEAAAEMLCERLRSVDAVLHNQDNREHDILDSDDYYQFQGGLTATVETLRGAAPRVYHGDHSRPEKPVVRSLGEEVARVVRGRAANPKWIAGVMRHGYKGAFEIAATVDYLFAYAALTNAVGDHHFDQLYEAYVADSAVRDFMAGVNPAALAEMAAKFREAIDRGLWSPRWNSAYDRLSALIAPTRREAAE